MPRNIFIASLMLPLGLAACGTPAERCISRSTQEYRAVSTLLDEVEGNLQRGYAWQERPVESDRLSQCRRLYRNKEGGVEVVYEPCYVDTIEIVRYRVAIDPAEETRKRDSLAARKGALSGKAQAAVQACKAAYPQ